MKKFEMSMTELLDHTGIYLGTKRNFDEMIDLIESFRNILIDAKNKHERDECNEQRLRIRADAMVALQDRLNTHVSQQFEGLHGPKSTPLFGRIFCTADGEVINLRVRYDDFSSVPLMTIGLKPQASLLGVVRRIYTFYVDVGFGEEEIPEYFRNYWKIAG